MQDNTTTASNSLQRQASWDQHSCERCTELPTQITAANALPPPQFIQTFRKNIATKTKFRLIGDTFRGFSLCEEWKDTKMFISNQLVFRSSHEEDSFLCTDSCF